MLLSVSIGCVSMRREKYIPFGGPDGGDGGDGGSVLVKVDKRVSSLKHLRTTYHAQSGGSGLGKAMTGKRGEDLTISVPLGKELRPVHLPQFQVTNSLI